MIVKVAHSRVTSLDFIRKWIELSNTAIWVASAVDQYNVFILSTLFWKIDRINHNMVTYGDGILGSIGSTYLDLTGSRRSAGSQSLDSDSD